MKPHQEKENKYKDTKKSLETERNLAILKHIFEGVDLKTLRKISRKNRIMREVVAKTSELTFAYRIRAMIKQVTDGNQESVRIDLHPAYSSGQLLTNINDFIPLDEATCFSSRIKMEPHTFSKNKVTENVKKTEKINKAISIPLNDFIAFLKTKGISLPLFADSEVRLLIVGTTEKSQPTSIILLITGKPKKRKNRRETLRFNKTLKPGLI